MKSQYKTSNTLLGFLAFIFRKEKYLEMAVNHGMAINLRAPDIKAAFEAGSYPKPTWRDEALLSEREHYKELSKSFYFSLLKSIALAAIAIAIGFFVGKINFEMPLSISKIVAFLGAFLATWGALIQFSPVEESYCKETLHENIHAFMAIILFVPGSIMAFIGALL